ncbi:hypothetical protein MTsPCn9_11980 [Croceitalea sp. MTPC9]|uniref:hypothetical protein n=1 Tax=unclassified Croceitalea TaxID=2632280 RepID=UPI002B3E4323|nr:hypothetical protein MTsPCn6_31660 [Croceitalea sp. MTPC6]GMN16262.1 hypothetical protein MTsPCn9_11980 [Croceitalea sp. MTPC9]
MEEKNIVNTWSAFVSNLFDRKILNSKEFQSLLCLDDCGKGYHDLLSVEKSKIVDEEFLLNYKGLTLKNGFKY